MLLTTSPGIAAVFFDHIGYYLIDPPFHALDRNLINMGVCTENLCVPKTSSAFL